MGYHFLLQRIFLTQGSNLGLLHCRQTLYCLSHQGSPTKWLKIAEIYSVTVLEVRSLKSSFWQAMISLKSSRRVSFLDFSYLLILAGSPSVPSLVAASLQSLPLSSHDLLSLCLCINVFFLLLVR